MNKMKTFQLVTACMLLMALVVGCGAKEDAYDKVIKEKKIVLGTSADYPPFEFHKKNADGKDEIVGYDIMIAKEIAKDLGAELVIEDMKFDSVLQAVSSSKVDFGMAGMDATPKRAEVMLFSSTVYKAEAGVLVRAEDKDKFNSPEDLKGLKIGVQKGSTFEDVATQIPDAKQDMLVKVNDLVLSLETKRVDAILVEKPVAQAYATNNTKVALSPVVLKPASEGYVAGMGKESVKLKEAIDKTIARLQADGSLDKFITEANALADAAADEAK
ncbi:transporter substrate-binding domain-containing protein [Paenibacillus taiwanensis]|uniref:transporter substrate-binding domain-containing protein n=1 Tax=Paenibacillus taiwanensis TaxID=401638 RepID=UPI0004286A3C|nr:transporter substrate-binding domain-containing protein [Paenibacillus taiwanensis]